MDVNFDAYQTSTVVPCNKRCVILQNDVMPLKMDKAKIGIKIVIDAVAHQMSVTSLGKLFR